MPDKMDQETKIELHVDIGTQKRYVMRLLASIFRRT
jgi:hypothetical protein